MLKTFQYYQHGAVVLDPENQVFAVMTVQWVSAFAGESVLVLAINSSV